MKHLLKLLLVVLFFLNTELSFSQKVAYYLNPESEYQQGIELFDKAQFGAAQKCFENYKTKGKNFLIKSDASFYTAACAIELFNKDGEWQMKRFVEFNPSSTKINSACFYLAKSSYRKKKYQEVLDNFEKVDTYKLEKEQLAELHFKRGYSYLQLNQKEKAKEDFFEIKDKDNKYQNPANFYYSHIAYEEKNYVIALSGFNSLVGNETFGSVVPYYITQIYFIQNQFKVVVVEAPKLLLDSANVKREAEINRMIGESYYNLKDYNNAIIYLKKTELGSGLNPKGNYVLGFCYYKLFKYAEAVQNFLKSTDDNDTLAQNAWYHVAECCLKINDKQKAKNAFYSAYQLNYDSKITEDALFSYAKLCYELDFSPYNDAVKSLNKYLKEYPNSSRKEECYKILVNVYSTTKNYDLAIKSIESFDNIDPVLKATYQKLIYFKGVENFNNNNLEEAEKQFKKSLSQNSDPLLSSLALYWMGEISYLRKDYTTAIDTWKKFQGNQGATQLQEFDLSNYALGYAYFQRKEKDDYTNANLSFRKFLLTKNNYDINKTTDATIRSADSYFMNKDFLQASEFYKKAIDLNKMDVDYALYQKALCDGLAKNYNQKIIELKQIETKYLSSHYLSSALNEIAETYYNNLKDYDNAVIYYERILKNYSGSNFSNNCYAQLGNIYYEKKQDDKAFEYYDKFVRLDNKSDAAKDILEAIKKIFEAKADVEGMEKYFASVGNPLSENQLEKASYAAASDAYYTQKNCDLAMPKWESYISKFPNGKYITEAEFNYAECAYAKNRLDVALKSYSIVVQKPRGIYSETSLSKLTYMLYKNKQYQEALPWFLQLQDIAESPANKTSSMLGAMRCAFYLSNFETALQQVTKVLMIEKLSPQQLNEAKYIKAKSLYETGRLDDAMIEFKAMTKASKNTTGAEAYYYIAKILFNKQEYKEVEKTITKLISYEYSNDDWNTKGMLLLADTYIARNEEADAEVVLKTIIENKPKQEFLDEANKKLQQIISKREQQKELQRPSFPVIQPEANELKINFNGASNDSLLFDTPLDDAIIEKQKTNNQQEQTK